MIERIVEIFEENDYRWSINGELIVPSADDLTETLDQLVNRIKDEPDFTQIELGRLIVKKAGDKYGVYVHIGDW